MYIKKLIFAPVFLIVFAFFNFYLTSYLKSPMKVFATDVETVITLSVEILILSILLLGSFLFFVVFACLAQDWRIVAGISLVASFLPFVFVDPTLAAVLSVGFLIAVAFIYPLLLVKLKSYITFQPTVLLSPSAKNLAFIMAVVISFAFYLSASAEIKQNGFQLPESLTNQILNMSGAMTGTQLNTSKVKGVRYVAQVPALTKEQIELLKQYPDILKSYGIDPNELDKLAAPQTPGTVKPKEKGSQNIPATPQNTLQELLNSEIQNMIKPYISWVPIILAFTFFCLVFADVWMLSFFLNPVIWFIFWVFRKTGFIRFVTEMRPVLKMVVT